MRDKWWFWILGKENRACAFLFALATGSCHLLSREIGLNEDYDDEDVISTENSIMKIMPTARDQLWQALLLPNLAT